MKARHSKAVVLLLWNTQQSSSVRFSPERKIREDTVIRTTGPHQKVFLGCQGGRKDKKKKKKGCVPLVLSPGIRCVCEPKLNLEHLLSILLLWAGPLELVFLPSSRPSLHCLSGFSPFLKHVPAEEPPAAASAGPRGAGVWHGAVPELPPLPTPRRVHPVRVARTQQRDRIVESHGEKESLSKLAVFFSSGGRRAACRCAFSWMF